MGSIRPETGQRRPGIGADLLQRAAEAVVKSGLEALIASGVFAAVFLGGLAYVMRDLPMVLAAASVLLLLLLAVAVVYVSVLRHRHRGLVAQEAPAAALRTRLDGLETLLQQLRAVDLEMTALRCHSRTDPETNPDEARRDCARVVLRPVWNQLNNAKAGRVRVAWHVWDEGRQRFRHVVATPEFRPAERDAVAQLGRDSAAGRALNEGAPIVIPDLSAPEALQLGWMPIPHHLAGGSTIQAPVYRIGGRVPNEWLGVISVDCDVVDAFDHADGDLLMEFAVKLNVIYEGMFDPDEPMDGTTGRT
ncbi:MAG TPA: GAF domain-containing protein [Candidatus Dormibacteraeota bacterium]|nr:GAF domain-containing protein [Candidatus Dormibacteraeota bacterium]